MTFKMLIFILSATLCHLSSSTIQKSKRRAKIVLTNAEDIGRSHYTIIDNLKLRLEHKLPNNSHEFMQALAEELIESLCDEGDYECEAMAYRHTLSGMSLVENINSSPESSMSHIRSELPNDFDFEIEMAIENSFAILADIKEIGHEKVIQGMNYELQKLKNSQTVIDEDHRTVGISAISVGIESTKQWTEVMSDPDHIFFKVPFVEFNAKIDNYNDLDYGEDERNLQGNTTSTGDISDFIPDFIPVDSLPDINLDVLDAIGLDVIPVVSKDVIGGSLGAIIGISSRKDGLIRSSFRVFSFTASSAVAGSVVGFFDSLAGLLNPDTCP